VSPEVDELLEAAEDVTMRTGLPRFELSRSARVNSLAVVAAYQSGCAPCSWRRSRSRTS
jgi:hypothetical protein